MRFGGDRRGLLPTFLWAGPHGGVCTVMQIKAKVAWAVSCSASFYQWSVDQERLGTMVRLFYAPHLAPEFHLEQGLYSTECEMDLGARKL
jgi:hypothetical protein